MPDHSDHVYYVVCDINYTNSCKDRTEQLALIPIKRNINDELGSREREKCRARTEKLMLGEHNKTKYMVQFMVLKFSVKMGVKVTKTHSVIRFKQDGICRDYILKNTN